jgi:hypothetical protein
MLPTPSPDARAHKNLKKKVRPSIFVLFYVQACVISEGDKSTTIQTVQNTAYPVNDGNT